MYILNYTSLSSKSSPHFMFLDPKVVVESNGEEVVGRQVRSRSVDNTDRSFDEHDSCSSLIPDYDNDLLNTPDPSVCQKCGHHLSNRHT